MRRRPHYRFNFKRLTALRQRIGLSPQKFAQRAGIPPQMVHNWESGDHRPSTASLEVIANTFGVDINYFFTDSVVQIEHEQPFSVR